MASVVDRDLIWTKNSLTFRFMNRYSGGGNSEFTQEIAEVQFQKACDTWSEPTNIGFSITDDETADIGVWWGPVDGVNDDAVGQAQSPAGDNKPIHIVFGSAGVWAASGLEITKTTFLAIALHEMGHALGLNHSRNPKAVMYSTHDPNSLKTELTTDDIDGAKFLYRDPKRRMYIVNETKATVSWFAFNSNDSVKITALSSGKLHPNELTGYKPKKNDTGKYYVRFTHEGGGTAIASGTAPRDSMVSLYLDGRHGKHVQVS